MTSPRDIILQRVRDALAPLPERASLPDWDENLLAPRVPPETNDRWTRFSSQLRSANGDPCTKISEVVTLLRDNQWLHGYCDPTLWPKIAAGFDDSFTVETTFDRSRLDDYAFGITAACGAIVETGTLILGDHTTSSRLGALAPWVHIAVVSPAQLHADLSAALVAAPDDPNLIWVTGPSKTADVEGILIEGVHGPGRQIALLHES